MLLLAGLSLAFSSCNREKKDLTMEKFMELTRQYVTEELQITGLDSVCVVKVDTVDGYEYAQIMVDLLHQIMNSVVPLIDKAFKPKTFAGK